MLGILKREGILGILGRKEVSATSENAQVRPIVKGQRGPRKRKRRRRVGRRDSIQPFHNENDVDESPFDIDSLPIPEIESSNTGGVGDDLNSYSQDEIVLMANESF